MIKVRPLSSTIRVVDDNSFVTEIPAKLKKAIDKMLPTRKRVCHTKIRLEKKNIEYKPTVARIIFQLPRI